MPVRAYQAAARSWWQGQVRQPVRQMHGVQNVAVLGVDGAEYGLSPHPGLFRGAAQQCAHLVNEPDRIVPGDRGAGVVPLGELGRQRVEEPLAVVLVQHARQY